MMNTGAMPWSPPQVARPATAAVDSAADGIAALYDRFGGLAFTLALRIVRDRGIAEDVVQEAFLAVWRHADRFDASRGSLQTWLCTVVRNRALDRFRGTAGRQRRDESLDAIMSLPGSVDVASEVVRHDESRAVVAALAALSPRQREAIELAYFGGYTQTEIAAMTSVPLGTIKSRTRSAMRALASQLAPMRLA
jgi:RNA polymerase sigma-70 factor (ECF subfamily)